MIMIGCPLCREPIPEIRALRHLESCVGAEQKKALWLATRETPPLRTARALAKRRPKKGSLKRQFAKSKKRGGKGGPSSPPALGHPPDASPQDRLERAHDATRDFAHSFRDNGRFGSHPSHDGYGDDDRP
jgi:hypothetical protein